MDCNPKNTIIFNINSPRWYILNILVMVNFFINFSILRILKSRQHCSRTWNLHISNRYRFDHCHGFDFIFIHGEWIKSFDTGGTEKLLDTLLDASSHIGFHVVVFILIPISILWILHTRHQSYAYWNGSVSINEIWFRLKLVWREAVTEKRLVSNKSWNRTWVIVSHYLIKVIE